MTIQIHPTLQIGYGLLADFVADSYAQSKGKTYPASLAAIQATQSGCYGTMTIQFPGQQHLTAVTKSEAKSLGLQEVNCNWYQQHITQKDICAVADALMKNSMFRTITALLPHQQEAVAKLLPARVGALFMDMGTGKSRTAIELARLRASKIDRVLWFCPVSLKETIRRQISLHTDCAVTDVHVFTDKTNQRHCPSAFWYIIGLESMSSSPRVVSTARQLIGDRCMVIVDESSYIKGHRAKRTNRVTQLATAARYRLILTGTPLTQGVEDLFSQLYFLSPKILGYRSWYSFAANHLEYSERYKGLIVRTHNKAWIAAKIRPYVYQVTKDECLSLPDKINLSRYCWLSDEQECAYDAAKQRFYDDVMAYDDGGAWQSSVPLFRLFTSLQSIVCGWDAWNETALPHHRLKLLRSVIDAIPPHESIVIWAKYHHCIREILNELPDAAQFHGGLSESNRNNELSRWNAGHSRYLVATQAAGGHGLDLTRARYAIFYAHGFKYAEQVQAEDRQHRIGQSRKVTYINLWADCKIEDRIANALYSKGNALRQFRDEVDKVKANRKNGLKKLLESL